MIALPAPCAHFRYAAPSLGSVCYALRLNKDCERDYFPFHFATYIERKKLKEHFNGKRKIRGSAVSLFFTQKRKCPRKLLGDFNRIFHRDLGLSLIHISIFYKVFKVFSSVLFTADRHPCQLVCKYGTDVRPYGTVKDGTRCSLDRKIKDVCIGGKCKVRQ